MRTVAWPAVLYLAAVLCLNACDTSEQEWPSRTLVQLDPGPGPAMGSRAADVVLLEFGSYACPYCANFHTRIWPAIRDEYIRTGQVRYLYREILLGRDSAFVELVSLVRCAGKLKDYWRAHDWIFTAPSIKNFRSMTDLKSGLVERLELDADRLQRCVASRRYEVAAGTMTLAEAADSLGVLGTPTFIIGRLTQTGLVKGWPLRGLAPLDTMRYYLDAALRAGR